MSTLQEEEKKPRTSGLVPHSVAAPMASNSLPTSTNAPFIAASRSAPRSTALPESRLAPPTPMMPPVTDRRHQDRGESQQTAETPTWPSLRPLDNPEDRRESAPTGSRYGLGIRPTYPIISSTDARYGSTTHFPGHGLAPYRPKHPHSFAHPDPRMRSNIYDSPPVDLRYGLQGRFSAPAAIPAIQNGHRRATSHITSKQSANVSDIVPTFSGLVSDMISHPFFAVIIKKVFEVCTEREVVVPNCATPLSNADHDACHLSNIAHAHGIEEGCAQSSSLEVFLGGVLCSLEDLKKRPASLYVPPTLQDTITACRHVATGDSRRLSAYPSAAPSHKNYGMARALSPLSDRRHSAPVLAVPVYQPIQPPVATGPRPKLSPDARRTMEDWFQEHYNNPYPTDEEKHALARKCGIRLNQVNNFFGNKRMRLKRKAMSISACENTARANLTTVDPSSVLAPRAKWRAMVLSKMPNGAENASTDRRDVDGSQGNITGQIFDAPPKRARYGEYANGDKANNDVNRNDGVPHRRSTENGQIYDAPTNRARYGEFATGDKASNEDNRKDSMSHRRSKEENAPPPARPQRNGYGAKNLPPPY